MLKISGVILCILGCAGFGFSKIIGWKKELEELSQWILLFQKMKSRILYQRDTLENVCVQMEYEGFGISGKIVSEIGMLSKQERAKEFSVVWNEEITKRKKESALSDMGIKMIQRFPEYVGEQDESLQSALFTMYLDELNRIKQKLETQLQEKRKPVLAISLISGMVISILLI